MPENPIYINVERRHYATREAAEAAMAQKPKEWFYVEDDEYIGVVREDGITFDYISRSQLFAPGSAALTTRIDCQANITNCANDVAFKLPVMSTAARDLLATVEDGCIILNSTLNRVQAYYSGAWNSL